MHAYLITGKTEEARENKAKSIFEKENAGLTVIITPEKNIHSIASIKSLIKSMQAVVPQKKGVLIKQANLLTEEAANAFLKNLEEPPLKYVIVLTAPNKEDVLETISSRCFLISLGKVSTDFNKEELQKMLEKIIKSNLGQRLSTVEDYGTRDQAKQLVVKLIFAGRGMLIEKARESKETKKLGRTLDLLEQARLDLEANVNPKLALAEALLHIP